MYAHTSTPLLTPVEYVLGPQLIICTLIQNKLITNDSTQWLARKISI